MTDISELMQRKPKSNDDVTAHMRWIADRLGLPMSSEDAQHYHGEAARLLREAALKLAPPDNPVVSMRTEDNRDWPWATVLDQPDTIVFGRIPLRSSDREAIRDILLRAEKRHKDWTSAPTDV